MKSTWPGRVDDVDRVVVPVARRRRRRDRDAALLLLDHPVHGRGALVDLADLVVAARVVQDPLGRRRLARVDVGHDPDVADLVERDRPRPWVSHRRSLPAVVGEGLVGLGHLVHVLAALRRRADAVGGVEDLVGEPVRHRLLAPRLGVAGEPADRERRRAARAHVDGDLVGRAAHAARPHLELGADVVDGALEHRDGVRLGLLGDLGRARRRRCARRRCACRAAAPC